jgi:hypothetical protein
MDGWMGGRIIEYTKHCTWRYPGLDSLIRRCIHHFIIQSFTQLSIHSFMHSLTPSFIVTHYINTCVDNENWEGGGGSGRVRLQALHYINQHILLLLKTDIILYIYIFYIL